MRGSLKPLVAYLKLSHLDTPSTQDVRGLWSRLRLMYRHFGPPHQITQHLLASVNSYTT